MYNVGEGMPSPNVPRHLEKALYATATMHYLLLSSLAINKKYLNFSTTIIWKDR
jgi:hypothetical protein